MSATSGPVLALAGGVGGAKLALGLSHVLPPKDLIIVVNTGDDEEFHGLHVSPDLDTVMYTLSGLADPERGWGLSGETFQALQMLSAYGAPTWFNLGDRDLATHLRRTQLLRQGQSLSDVDAGVVLPTRHSSHGSAYGGRPGPHDCRDFRRGPGLPGLLRPA